MDIDPSTGQASGSLVSSLLGLVTTVAIMYFGLKAYRDGANAGELTLGKGVVWSLAKGLIGGIAAPFSPSFSSASLPRLLRGDAGGHEAMFEEQGNVRRRDRASPLHD